MNAINGVGIDIIEISRIWLACDRTPGFMERIFTKKEIESFEETAVKFQRIAGKFAAKEAVAKAIGRSLSWQDVEITNNGLGKPEVKLYGKAKKMVGKGKVMVSISHCSTYATASAVFEGEI